MYLQKIRLTIYSLFLSFLLLSLTACNPFSHTTHLEEIQAHNKIIMGTINSSLTYTFDGTTHSGFDYELGLEFANYLNVELQIIEFNTLTELFQALDNEEIDFIGAGLTLTDQSAKKYRAAPPYYYVSQKVVYHKGTYRPREMSDITEPIGVLKNSSHEEALKLLSKDLPDLKITVLKDDDQESLLQKVADKEIKYALVDSSTLAQKQRYYPVLAEAFTITENLPVAWIINRNQDNAIYSAMIEFIGDKYQDQTITKLTEKYFGHVTKFDFVDTKIFLQRIESILPKYETLFKEYATEEIDWQLLASISYQESHWDPKAQSPTGVRGMMMLTRDTAKFVGVQNRLDPKLSIQGGAKYLSQLLKRLPESIPKDERIWFALASYNIGYGHLMDARRLAIMRKQNPNSWTDVKENLPLLHQKKWYQKTRYGYARGKEAQHYVNNIRQYNKTLTWFMTVKANEAAEEKEQRLAKEKAQAKQIEEQKTLTKEQLLTQVEKEIQVKENAIKQVGAEVLRLDKYVQTAKEKTLAADIAQNLAKKQVLALQQALKQNEEKALAAQKAFRLEKEKILAEQEILQEAENKARNKVEIYQQAYKDAFSTQQSYQQAKEKVLADQQAYQKDKEEALLKRSQYQAIDDKKSQQNEQETDQEVTPSKEPDLEDTVGIQL
jgi:membrane-bound lytic murein transglycosylase F